MQLSIVVPTYNVAPYLANCIESLLDQDIEESAYEIIVVNDGSTDESPAIAMEFEKAYPNIKVHHQENQGLSAARNTGIGLAKGKYIYFIDSDDYISRNTLGYVLELMEQHRLDVLGLKSTTAHDFNKKDAQNREVMHSETIEVTDGITFIAKHNYLNNAWWYFINREFLMDTALLFPLGRFVEDANFTAELIVKSQRIGKSSLDFYRYFIRQNSIMRRKSPAHSRKMIADYEKNVFDFERLIVPLRNKEHPKIKECLERLEARQQAFVFFLIIRCIKLDMSGSELAAILKRFSAIKVYPMDKFIGKDYKLLKYKVLNWVLNNQLLLFSSLRISPVVNRFFPLYHRQ